MPVYEHGTVVNFLDVLLATYLFELVLDWVRTETDMNKRRRKPSFYQWTRQQQNMNNNLFVSPGPTSAPMRKPDSHSPLQGETFLLLDYVRSELYAPILQCPWCTLFIQSATREDTDSPTFCLYSSNKDGSFICLLGKNGIWPHPELGFSLKSSNNDTIYRVSDGHVGAVANKGSLNLPSLTVSKCL